jgi:signal transduction histidine kinase/CheY-like chemotaxis protein
MHDHAAMQNHAHAHAPPAGESASFFENLFKVYTPRQVCMYHETPVIALHVVSDLLIALAYYSIPFALAYFVSHRRDLRYSWIIWMFVAFILACGTTHLIGVIDIWRPWYKIDGIVKLITAIASVGTAVALWPLIPKALALPSAAMLEQRVRERTEELRHANLSLRTEIVARERMEEEREQLLEKERTARSEAERANRLKDEFLATVSHELRTPLNAILGWAQLLQRGKPIDTEAAEGLEIIERNARAQAHLIQDLLDMSRIISGRIELEMHPVQLADVLNAAIDSVQPTAEAKGITIERSYDSSAVPIRGDFPRLQQVVWNLLTNAMKFTHRGGRVTVATRRAGSSIELTVADTGEGIAPEVLAHIFDRFRQADSSRSRRHGGLGLGLAIVKQLVELHGGTVWAESDGEGRGSTFVVELPIPPVAEHKPTDGGQPAASERPQSDLSGLILLVVDDEADSRELLRRILNAAGAEVFLAASGREAFDILQRERPQVLISDIAMPEEDGLEFLRRVRNLPAEKGGSLPAIALTAFAGPHDRLHSLRAGYQVHLSKPVERDELLATVASLAGRMGQ